MFWAGGVGFRVQDGDAAEGLGFPVLSCLCLCALDSWAR